MLTTYDGSAIVTDTQQDLIGEKYLEEQIKRAHDYQKKNSVIDRYSHLLYEGDKNYKSNSRDDIKAYAQSTSFASLKPVQQQEFVLSQTKLQPSSSNLFSSSSKLVPSSSRVAVQPQVAQTVYQPQVAQTVYQPQVAQTVYQGSKPESSTNLSSLQDQISALQNEKIALERAQQERIAYEQALREMAIRQGQAEKDQLKRQIEALVAQQKASTSSFTPAAGATTAANASSSSFNNHRQSSKLNSSSSINAAHLKSVTIDAYNDPNFKALLDQISKPLNVPAEKIELPAQWPSDGSLGKKKINFCMLILKILIHLSSLI